MAQLQVTLDAIDESRRLLLEDGPLSQEEADKLLEEWNDILKARYKDKSE